MIHSKDPLFVPGRNDIPDVHDLVKILTISHIAGVKSRSSPLVGTHRDDISDNHAAHIIGREATEGSNVGRREPSTQLNLQYHNLAGRQPLSFFLPNEQAKNNVKGCFAHGLVRDIERGPPDPQRSYRRGLVRCDDVPFIADAVKAWENLPTTHAQRNDIANDTKS